MGRWRRHPPKGRSKLVPVRFSGGPVCHCGSLALLGATGNKSGTRAWLGIAYVGERMILKNLSISTMPKKQVLAAVPAAKAARKAAPKVEAAPKAKAKAKPKLTKADVGKRCRVSSASRLLRQLKI